MSSQVSNLLYYLVKLESLIVQRLKDLGLNTSISTPEPNMQALTWIRVFREHHRKGWEIKSPSSNFASYNAL